MGLLLLPGQCNSDLLVNIWTMSPILCVLFYLMDIIVKAVL